MWEKEANSFFYRVLYKNNLFGDIPNEFGTFPKLKLLDLRDNKLSGVVPPELNKMLTPENLWVKDLSSQINVSWQNKITLAFFFGGFIRLLSGNKFAGFMKIKFLRLQSLYQVQLNKHKELSSASNAVFGCVNRKLGYW